MTVDNNSEIDLPRPGIEPGQPDSLSNGPAIELTGRL
jgi:hypothetical protein